MFLRLAFILLLMTSTLKSFAQNNNSNGWEFLTWDMKMAQVQDSLDQKSIDYSYDLNEGKGAYVKFKVPDYQTTELNLFFSMGTQFLYQVNTKKKFPVNEKQRAEEELERVVDYLKETWGAPIKEVADKTAPFCQYEIAWELEKTVISLTYCKTSSISLTINYNKK